jgi:environmental stress-induced protein Ves
MRILRAADHRVLPWKNGGGVTTEIAVFPEGAGFDAFEWRLSMATVANDGPFSIFPDVDRTLSVLEGEGIVLSIDGLPDETLTRTSAPFAFAADQPAAARLLARPITDLNIMTRRGRWMHRVARISGSRTRLTFGAAAATIMFCAKGSATVSAAAVQAALGVHDAALAHAAPCEVASGEGAELYVVTLDRTG